MMFVQCLVMLTVHLIPHCECGVLIDGQELFLVLPRLDLLPSKYLDTEGDGGPVSRTLNS